MRWLGKEMPAWPEPCPVKVRISVGGNAGATSFTFDGGIELTPTRLAVSDFKMTMGAETASGTLAFEQSATPSLKGRVALPKIDLEKWLALLANPGAFQPAQRCAISRWWWRSTRA